MNAISARRKLRLPATGREASTPAEAPTQQIIETHLREHVDPARRLAMVAEAAYFHAERRGFEPGHEIDDWLAAEDQISATFALADLQARALMQAREA